MGSTLYRGKHGRKVFTKANKKRHITIISYLNTNIERKLNNPTLVVSKEMQSVLFLP